MTVHSVDQPTEDLSPPTEQPKALNAVVVHRFLGDGNASVGLELVGDVRPTETVSILEMALVAARRQLASAQG